MGTKLPSASHNLDPDQVVRVDRLLDWLDGEILAQIAPVPSHAVVVYWSEGARLLTVGLSGGQAAFVALNTRTRIRFHVGAGAAPVLGTDVSWNFGRKFFSENSVLACPQLR